jgi:hypothetical protein
MSYVIIVSISYNGCSGPQAVAMCAEIILAARRIPMIQASDPWNDKESHASPILAFVQYCMYNTHMVSTSMMRKSFPQTVWQYS